MLNPIMLIGPREPNYEKVAEDLFTGADATLITAHTPTLGWTAWLQPSSGATFRIQANRCRQTTAFFGGRNWAIPQGAFDLNKFRLFYDMFPLNTWGASYPGVDFRGLNHSPSGNPTRIGRNSFEFGSAMSGTAGAGRTSELRLTRYGVDPGIAWNAIGVPLPDFETLGRRFVITVNVDRIRIQVQPFGGGASEHTFNFTITGDLKIDPANNYITINTASFLEFDNLTLETF